VFAQIAIFLGLLGTVSGILRSLGAITRSGIGETAIVTAGISEALITTAMGCIIAVPALMTYVRVANRAERKFFQFESYNHTFVDLLLRQREKMV
jgi:biopolymer transport protein ExbB